MLKHLSILASLLVLSLPTLSQPLTTVAERSGFQKTGRYKEVRQLSQAFAAQWPRAVRWEVFGRTPEGRDMLCLVVSTSGTLNPEQAKERDLPVVLFQGGIHPGEIDGKDAGFWALRELLENDAPALKGAVIVFVPVLNPDGHERFGPWNRPNQNGPQEMGWRVTSNNLNLNRDYTKADTVEMQSMLKLLNTWDPILYVDLHATDGAQFQPDVSLIVEPVFVGESGLKQVGKKLLNDTVKALKAQGSTPLDFYPSLMDSNDPESGFANWAFSPRYSTGYWALRNRLALLVETHSWKDYPTRVRVTRNIIQELIEQTAQQGPKWMMAAKHAEKKAQAIGGKTTALSFTISDKTRVIEFPGYDYQHIDSEVSGKKALIYDPTSPKIWNVPFYYDVIPKTEVTAPEGGYLVPPGHAAWMAERLTQHGIEFEKIQERQAQTKVQVFRATEVNHSAKPFEGRQTSKFKGDWAEEQHPVLAGSLYVPTAQAKAFLILALLEPQAPDSYAAWGFFNAHFEQKEYMEHYVAEQVGKEMLERDPELAKEFFDRIKTDPEFAKDPSARLNFFYQRHSSWDERKNLYPVMRFNPKGPKE